MRVLNIAYFIAPPNAMRDKHPARASAGKLFRGNEANDLFIYYILVYTSICAFGIMAIISFCDRAIPFG